MKGDGEEFAQGKRDEVYSGEGVEPEDGQDEEGGREVRYGDVDEERGAGIVESPGPDHDEYGDGVADGP